MPILSGGSGGGGGGGALALLSTTTVTGSPGTLDVSSIAQTATDLFLVAMLRGTNATSADTLQVRLNNDSGANYFDDLIRANGTTVSAIQDLTGTSLTLSQTLPAASAPLGASSFGFYTFEIPGYTSTTWVKGVRVQGGAPVAVTTLNTVPETAFGWWNSTAAVNRVTLFGGLTANLAVGSTVRIYGRT